MQLNTILATTVLLGTALCAPSLEPRRRTDGPCSTERLCPDGKTCIDVREWKSWGLASDHSAVFFHVNDPRATSTQVGHNWCTLKYNPQSKAYEQAPNEPCGGFLVTGKVVEKDVMHLDFKNKAVEAEKVTLEIGPEWRSANELYQKCVYTVPF